MFIRSVLHILSIKYNQNINILKSFFDSGQNWESLLFYTLIIQRRFIIVVFSEKTFWVIFILIGKISINMIMNGSQRMKFTTRFLRVSREQLMKSRSVTAHKAWLRVHTPIYEIETAFFIWKAFNNEITVLINYWLIINRQ